MFLVFVQFPNGSSRQHLDRMIWLNTPHISGKTPLAPSSSAATAPAAYLVVFGRGRTSQEVWFIGSNNSGTAWSESLPPTITIMSGRIRTVLFSGMWKIYNTHV